MSSPQYLLDTNALSDLIRRPRGPIAERIASVGEQAICTSIVVAAEFRYGAAKSRSEELADCVDRILSAIEVLPLKPPADRHYANIRHHLAQQGTPVGPNDMMIAAHARSLGLAVVTANIREFSRIEGLKVENWLLDTKT